MKSAQLDAGNGEPIKEVVIILDPKEVTHIHAAMKDYAAKHKRSKAIAKLLDELELAGIFF